MSRKASRSESNRKSNKGSDKKERRGSGVPYFAAIPVIIILVVIAVVLYFIWPKDEAYDGDPAALTETTAEETLESENGDTAEAETEATAEAPLPEIENSDSLTLSSVYTSSILNPDCDDEYAEEVASLEVTNSSDQYLVSAELTAVMSDGTEVRFILSDLPSGAAAEVFDTANQSLDSGVTCESIECTSEEYLEEDVLMTDTIEILSDESGAVAVLTNTGEKDLTGLTVVYHCDMAGQYFGGTSYTTTIENLAAGESYELSDDTLLGGIAVVRVYQ